MAKFFKKSYRGLLSPRNAALVLGIAALILTAPFYAHAQAAPAQAAPAGSNGGIVSNIFGGIVSAVVGWPVFIISYIIASIFGLGISIISYFISVVLQLNMQIIGSNIVSSGFTVTLALANLGFVLSIIIIAIATILRYETYALKQTLWKLVAAAILVNFSLVICGAILNFSNQLSFYFLESINPGGNTSSFVNFASALAGSFGPQKIFLAGSPGSNASGGNTGAADLMENSGQRFGSILVNILNIIFPTLFLIVAVIALGGLFIMLLIRYVYLGILLIIMPMAWLLWIFPATTGQWQKWWSKFIQWTMFAPIALFFIWLALLTMGGNDPNNIQGVAFQSTASNPIVASISNVTGNILSGLLGPLLQMAMMIAMLFAGLFMAQSMGITFASTTIKGASAVTSGFGKWSGRLGRRVATAPVRTETGRKFAAGLQQTRIGAGGGRLAKVAGAVANYGLGWAGRGVENLAVAGGEKLTSEYADEIKNLTKDQVVHQFSSSNAPRRIALLERAQKEGWLGDIQNLESYVSADRQAEFARYGQGKLYGDVRNESAINLRELVGNWNKAQDGAPKTEAWNKVIEHLGSLPNPGLLASMFFQDLDDLNAKKKPLPLGMELDEARGMQSAIAKGVAAGFSPNNLSGFFQKLAKGNQLKQFETIAQGSGIDEGGVSEANQRWLNGSGARNLGIGMETFTGNKKSESKIEIPVSTGGTPRSGTTYPPTPPPKP